METDRYYNIANKNMTFSDVFKEILDFIQKDPNRKYNLSIGTDSQVHSNKTCFITAIHLHRVGKGAWGCLKENIVPRRINSIHEKISMETTLSQEVAYQFTEEHLKTILDKIIPFLDESGDFNFEIHLDIGQKGITRDLIYDMINRIKAMGIEAKIKPDSYAASSYANRFTK